eukprot:gene26548-31925_t
MRMGASVIMIVGANPKRDADASLGGPRSVHAIGATPVMLDIHVDDVDRVMHHATAEGGHVRNAVEELDNGDRVGVLTDPFGHFQATGRRNNRLPALLSGCKSFGCSNQFMHNARFRDGMPGIFDNAKIRFRPDLFQMPGVQERRAHVIAAMHENAGNFADQMGIAQEVVIRFEEAPVLEIMAFDACKRDGEMIAGKSLFPRRI